MEWQNHIMKMEKYNMKQKFVNGKREGIEKGYTNTGVLVSEIPYKNGEATGLAKFYNEQTGKLEYEENLVNGKRNGLSKKYYPSGRLLSQVTFKK